MNIPDSILSAYAEGELAELILQSVDSSPVERRLAAALVETALQAEEAEEALDDAEEARDEAEKALAKIKGAQIKEAKL
ncbi:MAG: hypothetical protein U9Q81_15045 [Pseudomonadota bacterium]|nr:hypothetical protein [Pseudomonadota bacterium]